MEFRGWLRSYRMCTVRKIYTHAHLYHSGYGALPAQICPLVPSHRTRQYIFASFLFFICRSHRIGCGSGSGRRSCIFLRSCSSCIAAAGTCSVQRCDDVVARDFFAPCRRQFDRFDCLLARNAGHGWSRQIQLFDDKGNGPDEKLKRERKGGIKQEK